MTDNIKPVLDMQYRVKEPQEDVEPLFLSD